MTSSEPKNKTCADDALLLTKEMFLNKEDYDQQLISALSKFSSMGGKCMELTRLEQLLVNELLGIGYLYPDLNGIETINPFA